ncbi:MAG: fumarylacetoacetate hydrolase family protein [Hydrogenophaga sp.]|nr:fumarylacetoacetate hydrolase family protein [Hydrogenophaga sp.]
MNQPFHIGVFESAAGCFVGAVRHNKVWRIDGLLADSRGSTSLGLLDNWSELEPLLASAMERTGDETAIELAGLTVKAPLIPRQIFCSGANYRKHVIELTLKQTDPAHAHLTPEQRAEQVAKMMDERAATGKPFAFVKLPSAVTGPYDQIILPRGAKEVDWELELAVVIGKCGRHIAAADALSHVAGYTVANDITARDRVYRPDLKAIGTDWLASKCAATFLPLGPWITPSRFVAEPDDLQLTLRLNGDVMQHDNSGDMIFSIARQIEYISSYVTLLPGDVICTGSPAGNGTHYQRFLQPGDVVEGEIAGLGLQRLICVAEDG